LFDSFEELPEPKPEDGIQAAEYCGGANSGMLVPVGQCEASIEGVRDFLLGDLQLHERDLDFHVGWFQDTIPDPATAIKDIALLRLDGDWYESTKVCLDHLYDRVSPQGIIILEDYFCWEGCRKATDEFRAARMIETPIVRIDLDSGYWIKPD
jgi:O-methyltransferase